MAPEKALQNFFPNIKMAQKPYIIGSLGPKVLKHESFEGKGLQTYHSQKCPVKRLQPISDTFGLFV